MARFLGFALGTADADNLRQGVHPQYLESGCNFEHYLGFRVDCNKHNLWPAWVDPKNVVEAMSSWLFDNKLLEPGVNANGGRIGRVSCRPFTCINRCVK